MHMPHSGDFTSTVAISTAEDPETRWSVEIDVAQMVRDHRLEPHRRLDVDGVDKVVRCQDCGHECTCVVEARCRECGLEYAHRLLRTRW